MAKVKQPLLSFDARRKLGDDIVFTRRRGANIVEKKPVPEDAKSLAQLTWRHMFEKVVALWHALSAAEKQAWESLGRKRHMTGYAWFVSQALRPNPGIYLPLQGGTMQGIIDMGGYAIQSLLDPVNPQDADTEAARDATIAADILTHKGDASAHHIRYSDAEALAAAEAGGLNKIVWLAVSSLPLIDTNRTVTLNWTDLDLTALTSPTAKFAIILIAAITDSYTSGVNSVFMRKNGETPTYAIHHRHPVGTGSANAHALMVIIALDSGQVLEYRIELTGTAQIDTYFSLLGYIE